MTFAKEEGSYKLHALKVMQAKVLESSLNNSQFNYHTIIGIFGSEKLKPENW